MKGDLGEGQEQPEQTPAHFPHVGPTGLPCNPQQSLSLLWHHLRQAGSQKGKV